MKPGDHPEFFRVEPPEGTSRESTIVLDREGRFSHDGAPIDQPKLEQALRTWVSRHPDDGRPILTNGYDWCYFRFEDAPFFVDALRVEPGGAVTLRLFDGTEEPLDPKTLSLGKDGVVYAIVKPARLEARFSRHAQTQLEPILVEAEPPTVVVEGRTVILPHRSAPT